MCVLLYKYKLCNARYMWNMLLQEIAREANGWLETKHNASD